MATTHDAMLARLDLDLRDSADEMLFEAKEDADVEETYEEETMSDGNPSEPVKPLLVTNLDALGCQNNCGGPLKAPIKQCLAGHLFCCDCHRGHFECMLCEENKLFPAPSVDAILTTILDVCPFEFCKKQIPFYQLEDHIEGCGYSMKCPIPECVEMRVSRYEMEPHLTRIHGKHVYSFHIGLPVRFAFGIHDDTRVLIESQTKLIFVVDYEVNAESTSFNFFCPSSIDGLQFTYKIMDHNAKTALSAESTVPIITVRDKVDAVRFGGSLSNQLRTGDEGNLYCSFVITAKPSA